MNLLVCIPTITGREHHLEQAVRGYHDRTPDDVHVNISIVKDRPTCGIGWQACVDQALLAAEQGASAAPDYIHFSNDDIVVAHGWLDPLVETVRDEGWLPCPRMEPAGYHLGQEPAVDMAPALAPAVTERSYWYSDLPEKQPQEDWAFVDHGSLPFCSLHQWKVIGPFLPIHFGTDKWFYWIGRKRGYAAVARMDSVIYNYAVQIGRAKDDWAETDFIDFDLMFAYPEYVTGERPVTEPHPLRGTPEGLALVRDWRRKNFDGPYHWEV